MKTNLELATELAANDLPIPTDLTAALLEEGIDVAALFDAEPVEADY